MSPIKIVLADGHEFLREGIIAILKCVEGFQVVAATQNCSAMFEAIELHDPCMVIMDLNMPGCDQLNLIPTIKLRYPALKILALSNPMQSGIAEKIHKLGGEGYMVKNSTSMELIQAIREIMDGKLYYKEKQENTVGGSPHVDQLQKKFQLTKRETDIVRLICQEMSTREIAATLFLSELTINTHRRNILRKLEVKNVAGLMNFAREHQLV